MAVLRHTLGWINAKPLRFYSVVLILSALPLGALLLVAHEILLRQTTTRLVTQSSQSGRLIGRILEQHLQESSAALQSYATRTDLVEDTSRNNWDSLGPHLSHARTLRPDFANLAIYDSKGVLRSTHPTNSAKLGSNASGHRWFTAVGSALNPSISGAYRSQLAEPEWVVAIVVPLRNARNHLIGYLVGEQTLEKVTGKIYGLTRASSTALITFIDHEGRTFARLGGHVKVFPAPAEVLAHIRKPEAEKGTIIRVNGRDHLVAYSPIAALRWGTYIQVPMSALRPALWAYEKNILLASLVILAVILSGSGYVAALYRRIAKQNLEIERASRMKSRFMASMSHEIRTPLNAILGFASLLEESTLEARQRRWCSHVHRAGLHLLQLVNDILDLSKIEAGELDLKCEPFDLRDAVPEVTAVLAPLAAQKNIEPQILVEDGLLIYADRIRFKQILYNLMSNAIKFTPDGGKVELKAVAAGNEVELIVADTGIGIAEQDQEVIFDEFEQVGEAANAGEGTGLGLAITRKLVEQHGGSIRVSSRKGAGSLFIFTLPRPLGDGAPMRVN